MVVCRVTGVGLQAARPGEGDALAVQVRAVGTLTDGDDDRVGEQRGADALVVLRVEALVLVEDRRAGLELEPRHALALVDEESLGPEAVDDLDVAFQGLLDLMRPGGHLLALLQADQGDVLGAQALGGERHVDGHVAAADDEHVLADFDFLAQGGIAQEVDPLQHARDILVFDARGDGRRAGRSPGTPP